MSQKGSVAGYSDTPKSRSINRTKSIRATLILALLSVVACHKPVGYDLILRDR